MSRDKAKGIQSRPQSKAWGQKLYLVLAGIMLLLAGFIWTRGGGAPLFLWSISPNAPKITDWLIIGVTLAYAVVSGMQWFVMRDALQLTRESHELGMRAWVLAHMGQDSIPVAAKMVLPLRFKNYGRTPAQSIVDVPRFHVGDKLVILQAPIDRRDERYSWSVLGPDASADAIGHIQLTPEQQDMIRSGKAGLWAYGYIDYSDPFSKHRRTRYCFRYDPDSGRFAVAHMGNSAE
jgi:hypothetical protein